MAWQTVNEARDMLDMNALADPIADQLPVPTNNYAQANPQTPPDIEPPQSQPGNDAARAAARKVLRDTLERISTRISGARQRRQAIGTLAHTIREAIGPAIISLAGLHGRTVNAGAAIDRYIGEWPVDPDKFIDSIMETPCSDDSSTAK
jgi:hypothetical protein